MIYISAKNIEHIYSVEYKRSDKDGKLVGKPKLNITDKIKYENLKRDDNSEYLILTFIMRFFYTTILPYFR